MAHPRGTGRRTVSIETPYQRRNNSASAVDLRDLDVPGGPLDLARIAWQASERADNAEARALRLERENAELRACLTRAASDLTRMVDRLSRKAEQ